MGVLMGCENISDHKKSVVSMKTVCLKLYFVNGLTKEASFRIPSSSQFKVKTSKGSYWLETQDEDSYYYNYKSGVIDFDIINCK